MFLPEVKFVNGPNIGKIADVVAKSSGSPVGYGCYACGGRLLKGPYWHIKSYATALSEYLHEKCAISAR